MILSNELLLAATAPTACGIETSRRLESMCSPLCAATAPTACGIETATELRHVYFISRLQ